MAASLWPVLETAKPAITTLASPSRHARRLPGPPPTSGAAADPLLAALVGLLLPEWHGLLERVDRVLAGGERIPSMRRRDGDHHACFADLDAADAMVDRDRAQFVAALEVGGELRHHVLGHLRVGLVFEMRHISAA